MLENINHWIITLMLSYNCLWLNYEIIGGVGHDVKRLFKNWKFCYSPLSGGNISMVKTYYHITT